MRGRDWEAEFRRSAGVGRAVDAARRDAGNPAVGLYRTRDDRWFHVHGGLPHLADRIMWVLDTDGPGIRAAVARWEAEALEDALAEAGTCGVAVRDAREWLRHPQGRALRGRPAVEVLRVGDAPPRALPCGDGPLGGLRVLDLSLALAGPVCARTLAEHGAEVLRIAAPDRADRQPFEVETGHGKRAAWLGSRPGGCPGRLPSSPRGLTSLRESYRPGALARRGFGVAEIAARAPGIVYVSINCYGHEGPWSGRRGQEGLAQATTGLTVRGRKGDRRASRRAPSAII